MYLECFLIQYSMAYTLLIKPTLNPSTLLRPYIKIWAGVSPSRHWQAIRINRNNIITTCMVIWISIYSYISISHNCVNRNLVTPQPIDALTSTIISGRADPHCYAHHFTVYGDTDPRYHAHHFTVDHMMTTPGC